MTLRLHPALKRLIWLVAILAVAYGIYHFFFSSAPEQAAPPPTPVNTVTVQPADIPAPYEYSGRTAGSREVEVRARISGLILQRLYQEGAKVKEGDILFKIEPDHANAVAAQAKASLLQAERDWKRVSELFAAGALSARERDEALAAVQGARASVQQASIDVDYTTVVAPITGVTSQEAESEGSLVVGNESLLTRVTQIDPLYVNFAYPDTEYMDLKQQMASGAIVMPADGKLQAELHFGDGSVYKDLGQIDFTDSIIDTDTGSVRARATVANPAGDLLPGQFVRVVVKGLIHKNVLTVPDKAMIQGPAGTIVYVVDGDNKAQVRPVVPGQLVDGQRIIASGLNAGDKVIADGMIKVMPGNPVAPTDITPAAPAPAPAPAAPAAEPAPTQQQPAPAAAPATAPAAEKTPEKAPAQ